METEEEIVVHLVNVLEDEAKASLEHHGHPKCQCGAEPSIVALLRPPGEHAWGQNISAMGACEAHRAPLDTALAPMWN
jgi:hypothetical protein